VLDEFGHVQRDDEATPQAVTHEKRRDNADFVGTDELLDQTDQLSDQKFLVARPVLLHLVIHVTRGFENDPLRAELPRQLVEIDLGDSRYVGLAFDDRGEFREFRGVAGI
jgi:hypothetical protein